MAKHVFLTGEIGIGKSTALNKFLREYGADYDGIVTAYDRREGDRVLSMYRADSRIAREEWENVPCARVIGDDLEIYAEVFDGFGTEVLLNSGKRELILMDELGTMEERAPLFKAAVLRLLDGDVPVYGVVKLRNAPFLDAVRAHAQVEVITVTADNRDEVPKLLRERFALNATR
ncbi:MAG: nucleoside-triphosphatase [Oscillospiraceae bacterium]|jgi:nucleoside-triphosphatase|nr:nucleoside-triphosphatase [Oscillospiraceae bacterium]